MAEGRDQRLQHDRHHRRRHREAEQSGRPLAELARRLARGDEFLEGGHCPRQEPLAGLGQADAACRADEERRADAALEGPNRLADGRGRHSEFDRRFAKIAMPGNAQKRLDTVERAVSDCEVLLHSLSILYRIAARRKQPHVRVWA